MTKQPREFWLDIEEGKGFHDPNEYISTKPDVSVEHEFIHVLEAAPVLEKIARLELALQKCKKTVDACLDPCGIDNKELEAIGNKAILTMLKIELESILEPK